MELAVDFAAGGGVTKKDGSGVTANSAPDQPQPLSKTTINNSKINRPRVLLVSVLILTIVHHLEDV